MIHQEHVRRMSRKLIYEQGKGREELRVCKVKKQVYVAGQMTITFFVTLVACLLLFLAVDMVHFDEWRESFSFSQIRHQIGAFILVLIFMMVLFQVITVVYARKKYERCYAGVQSFKEQLEGTLNPEEQDDTTVGISRETETVYREE